MRLAIFDIDGTLTAPHPHEDRCFLDALDSALGISGVDPDWSSYDNVTDSGLVHELVHRFFGRFPTRGEVRGFHDAYCARFFGELEANPCLEISGAASFLRDLRADPDWRVAIATGNFRSVAVRKLRDACLPASELPMATADDAISRRDLVRLAITRARERYGAAEFDHRVSIGDAPWDRAAARTIQVPFLAVGSRCGGDAENMIANYLHGPTVLSRMNDAVCW